MFPPSECIEGLATVRTKRDTVIVGPGHNVALMNCKIFKIQYIESSCFIFVIKNFSQSISYRIIPVSKG